MHQITILLTNYPDRVSRLIQFFTRNEYSHASIGLSGNPEEFYSFNKKGLAVETLEKHRRRGARKSMSYQIQIPEEVYSKIEQSVNHFLAHRSSYRYTWFGVICCLLHLPRKKKNHYFCSQFVAELLQESGAASLHCNPAVCTPARLSRLLKHHPSLVSMAHNVL